MYRAMSGILDPYLRYITFWFHSSSSGTIIFFKDTGVYVDTHSDPIVSVCRQLFIFSQTKLRLKTYSIDIRTFTN
jgi:hypothetical protein